MNKIQISAVSRLDNFDGIQFIKGDFHLVRSKNSYFFWCIFRIFELSKINFQKDFMKKMPFCTEYSLNMPLPFGMLDLFYFHFLHFYK